MLTSPDFREVGGYAVMKYTEPRFTKDLDLWISIDEENSKAIYATLKEFGAPLKDLYPADFTQKDYFYQMGNPPFRLDIMMSIPGVTFEVAWANREKVRLEGFVIPFISKADLIEAKETSARDQDLIDVKKLRKTDN